MMISVLALVVLVVIGVITNAVGYWYALSTVSGQKIVPPTDGAARLLDDCED